MHIIKLKPTSGESLYKVESQSKKGTFYFVNTSKMTCSCPEWRFRMAKIEGICKHINAVQEKETKHGTKIKEPSVLYKTDVKKRKQDLKKKRQATAKKDKLESKYQTIIDYVRVRGSVDSITLIEKFGEDIVDDMLRLGELLEENGQIKILE